MPIKAYVGLPRHGKSYEVVTEVILPALRQGRRVVSNIAGLNQEAFNNILFAEGFTPDKIGQIISIDHEQVLKPDFFRTDEDDKTGTETFIQPGDLLALDEIWRFWKKRGIVPERHLNFFRMHGHFTHPATGLTCEVCLITQSIRDVNENIRDVVAETFQMVKNTKLGSDTSYIVHIFQRGSTSKTDFIRTLPPRFYKPEFFVLYKSHSQRKEGDAVAVEANPDKRGSILQGAFFKFGIPFALLMFLPAGYFIYKFFNPAGAPAAVAGAPAVAGASAPAASSRPRPAVVESWRVVGNFLNAGKRVFIIENISGAIRLLVNPPLFQVVGSESAVELPEGGFAVSWVAFQKLTPGVLP